MRRSASFLALALLGACRYPATVMVVRMDTDLPWGPNLSLAQVELTVWRGAQTATTTEAPLLRQRYVLGSGNGLFALPGTRAFERRGDPSVPLTVSVTAYDPSGAALFETRAIAPFQDRATVVLDVFLAGRCRFPQNACAPDMTCGRTGCERIDRSSLPVVDPSDPSLRPDVQDVSTDFNSDLDPLPDLPVVPDAVNDVAGDTSMDAGPDAAPDAAQDAALDAPSDGSTTDAVVPVSPNTRPIAPLSTARVATATPTLRWVRGTSDVEPTSIMLCRNRALDVRCNPAVLDVASHTASVAPGLASGVWFWSLQGTNAGAAAPVWQIVVPGTGSGSPASSWGSYSDLDGDGVAEVLAGAPDPTMHLGSVQQIRFSGGTPSLSATDAFAGTGGGDHSSFGYAVSSAGDLNGDGYPDALLGEPDALGGVGSVTIVYGHASTGSGTTRQLSAPSGTGTSAHFGYAVSSAGDLDGDGYGDVLVGAPGDATTVGHAYLYSGSATGLRLTATRVFDGASGALFGASVSYSAPTVMSHQGGVLIGAPGTAPYGAVFLYVASAAASTPPETFDQSGLGTAPASSFGASLSSAGDLDGDGYPELVVGAPGAAAIGAGCAYVFAGGASGYSHVGARQLLAGIPTYVAFGTSLAAGVDLSGDGLDDLAVGGPGANVTVVFRGAAGGVDAAPWSTLNGPAGATSPRYGASVSLVRMGIGGGSLVVGAPGFNSAYAVAGGATLAAPGTRVMASTINSVLGTSLY